MTLADQDAMSGHDGEPHADPPPGRRDFVPGEERADGGSRYRPRSLSVDAARAAAGAWLVKHQT